MTEDLPPKARSLDWLVGSLKGASHGPVVRRRRRVVLLLVLLWVLNSFDLMFTIIAHNMGTFNEANPIARYLLEHPYAVTAFKLGTLVFASVVLLSFSHLRLVELSCWTLCGVYVVLSVIWLVYFERNSELILIPKPPPRGVMGSVWMMG